MGLSSLDAKKGPIYAMNSSIDIGGENIMQAMQKSHCIFTFIIVLSKSLSYKDVLSRNMHTHLDSNQQLQFHQNLLH